MESCFLNSVVGLAENGVELTHPTGPVLRHVALHEQAVAVADVVSMWLITATPRFLSLKSLE